MKQTELMIGDWVTGKKWKENPFQITCINDGGKFIYGKTVTSTVGPFFAEELEPIPLTREILEMNGFELNGELPFRKEFRICFNEDTEDERHLFVEYHHKSGYVKLTYQTYTGHHNGTNGIVINHCGVHQFQHALRICGLDELADNLKLEE